MIDTDNAIIIKDLSKKYSLGIISTKTLSGDLSRLFGKLFGKEDQNLPLISQNNLITKSNNEEVWALKNINLKIKKGEIIGIIGKNGAGKSTLLKILSRITSPSNGVIKVSGRIASLLEVGTGFHPELTGKENIYLNGAILGMKKIEIDQKFDEIVEFSGILKYIDTPVKRYSSGMRVRLAFSVAAYLEADILLVDEVLAVGDVDFQKKAIGKIKDVTKEGTRTVLFVSHNLASIRQLCKKCILMDEGELKEYGSTRKIIGKYLSNENNIIQSDFKKIKNRKGNGEIKFIHAILRNDLSNQCNKFSIGDNLVIDFIIERFTDLESVKIGIEIITEDGIKICNMINDDSNFSINNLKRKENLVLTLPDIRFYPGTYFISLWAGNQNSLDTYDRIENCISFQIIDGGRYTNRSLPRYAGLMFFTPSWKRIL